MYIFLFGPFKSIWILVKLMLQLAISKLRYTYHAYVAQFNLHFALYCPPPQAKRGTMGMPLSVRPCNITLWFPDDNSRTLNPIILKFDIYMPLFWVNA